VINGLLIALIVLMSLTLIAFVWAMISFVYYLRPRVDKMNENLNRVLTETIPALEETQHAIHEAHRALSEAASTLENVHIVSDNLRHKIEVVDSVAGKVRKIPETTARVLGTLLGVTMRAGGRFIAGTARDIAKRRRTAIQANGQPTTAKTETEPDIIIEATITETIEGGDAK
jgi:Flp pilus assembly protein TadB